MTGVRLDEAAYQKADLEAGLESTVALLYPELGNRISVVKEYGEIPEILCYPAELNQVFMNLLSNAIQAIEEEGIIHIETFTEAGSVVIRISDTVRGIPPEYLKRIFDPGFKASGVGTGLGLSISYNIMQKHWGEIEVESVVDKGSTFMLRVPAD